MILRIKKFFSRNMSRRMGMKIKRRQETERALKGFCVWLCGCVCVCVAAAESAGLPHGPWHNNKSLVIQNLDTAVKKGVWAEKGGAGVIEAFCDKPPDATCTNRQTGRQFFLFFRLERKSSEGRQDGALSQTYCCCFTLKNYHFVPYIGTMRAGMLEKPVLKART